MRITKETANLYKVTLSCREAVLDFIKENYPSGPLGELLFKADAAQYGLNEAIKFLENTINNEKYTKYNLIIIGDAKGKYNKFGLTSVSGEPFYCGNFLEAPSISPDSRQNVAEANALVYAMRLCRNYCYYKRIKLNDFTLIYLTDSQATLHAAINPGNQSIITHMIADARREIPINLKIDWIRGVDNLADKYTLLEMNAVHPQYEMMDKFLNKY